MSLTVIESKVVIQIPDSIWNVDIVFQVHFFILYAPPQTLYEDIIPEAPTTIPAYLDFRRL